MLTLSAQLLLFAGNGAGVPSFNVSDWAVASCFKPAARIITKVKKIFAYCLFKVNTNAKKC
jgi:hypothetical protein